MIRPAEPRDIPRLVELHCQAFGDPGHEARARLGEGYRQVLMEHPWSDGERPSLVYEEEGTVQGLIGVMPRPGCYGERHIWLASLTKFIVSDTPAAGLISVKLLRSALRLPIDLITSDWATPEVLPIWTRVGGEVLLDQSLWWRRSLRPLTHAVGSLSSKRRWLKPLKFLRPIAGAGDRQLSEERGWNETVDLTGTDCREVADVDELLALMDRIGARRALRPRYTAESLAWNLRTVEEQEPPGSFRTRVVEDDRSGEPVGWFTYSVRGRGEARVFQLDALESDSFQRTYGHLLLNAVSAGAVFAEGIASPHFLASVRDDRLTIRAPEDRYTLAYSRESEILSAFRRGDALVTRLESEWW